MPGFRARFIYSAHMTFALWDIEPGALLPEHSHHHEQVTQVQAQAGTFEITLEGVTSIMTEGMTLVIPPHARHSGRALTPRKVLDVFWPVRNDHLEEMNLVPAGSGK